MQLNLKNYKLVRTNNKFPLPQPKPKINKQIKPNFIDTIGIVSKNDVQSYEMHVANDGCHVLIFNDHQYLKREFSCLFRPGAEVSVNREFCQYVQPSVLNSEYNLLIFNALDLVPIEQLLFPWKEYTQYKTQKQQPSKQTDSPPCVLKTVVQSMLQTKRNKSIVTISVIGIRSDGTLEDQLNYQWIEESKYVEDLIKLKEKSKLKVKKYKTEIKAFDLNRQQVKDWEEAEEIFYHYAQIKQYLNAWKKELYPSINAKIGQLYQICQLEIDQELGTITNIFKRKVVLKFNQYMPESNLVMMKISQLLKQRVQGIKSVSTRDFPVIMFLKECFQKNSTYFYTLVTQLGTNDSLKEEVICLNMDLQVPGNYNYLKNYCDKPEIIQQVRQKAISFVPMTSQQKAEIKIGTADKAKMKTKSINMLKQGEQISSKSFFFDTFSSNQKKKPTYNDSYSVQNALQLKRQMASHIYGPNQKNSGF